MLIAEEIELSFITLVELLLLFDKKLAIISGDVSVPKEKAKC